MRDIDKETREHKKKYKAFEVEDFLLWYSSKPLSWKERYDSYALNILNKWRRFEKLDPKDLKAWTRGRKSGQRYARCKDD